MALLISSTSWRVLYGFLNFRLIEIFNVEDKFKYSSTAGLLLIFWIYIVTVFRIQTFCIWIFFKSWPRYYWICWAHSLSWSHSSPSLIIRFLTLWQRSDLFMAAWAGKIRCGSTLFHSLDKMRFVPWRSLFYFLSVSFFSSALMSTVFFCFEKQM